MADFAVFWIASRDPEVQTLKMLVQTEGGAFLVVSRASLTRKLVPALASGAVIVVVSNDRQAREVLTLGADEVVRAAEVSEITLAEAIARASARARGRLARRTDPGTDAFEALTLLFRAMESQIGHPLRSASVKCDALSDEVDKLLSVSASVATWGKSIAPLSLLRELAGTLRSQETQHMLAEIRQAIERAEAVVRTLGQFSHDEQHDGIDVAPVLEELAGLLRQEVSVCAELVASTEGVCPARISRPVLVCCMTLLVANAIESVRAKDHGQGRVELRTFNDGTDTVIEVFDDGAEILTELRPDLVDSHFPGPRLSKVQWVRQRVRQVGGDLIVDSGPEGTNVRVFLPAFAEDPDLPVEPPYSGKHPRSTTKSD